MCFKFVKVFEIIEIGRGRNTTVERTKSNNKARLDPTFTFVISLSFGEITKV